MKYTKYKNEIWEKQRAKKELKDLGKPKEKGSGKL
jgi:hypothetical protein